MPHNNASLTEDQFKFHCNVEVRFRDLDAMGHVNNAIYFTYFEMGRTAYMKAVGYKPPENAAVNQSFPFILAEISCRFISAASLEETLSVYVRTLRTGRKSFDFEYLITEADSGRHIANGRSVQVYYDYEPGRSVELPKDFRCLLEQFDGLSKKEEE